MWDKHAKIYEYWLSVKQDKLMPRWHSSSFDLASLDLNAIPYASIFDVLLTDFRFRFFGTQRVILHGKDYTDHLLSEYQPETIRHKIEKELKQIVKSKEPMTVSTVRTNPLTQEVLSYEFLYLPLSNNDKDVDTIFTVGFDEKTLRVLHREYDEIRKANLEELMK
jgi:hypothetical protein